MRVQGLGAWQYMEGLEIWDEYPNDVVYGWEDDDGNRISFPYRARVEGVSKHNWEAMGMHPLHDYYYSSAISFELKRWVHDENQIDNVGTRGWITTLEFVGTDASTLGEIKYCDEIKELYAPYLEYEMNDEFTRVGDTSGVRTGTWSMNSFLPTSRVVMQGHEKFSIEIINEINLKKRSEIQPKGFPTTFSDWEYGEWHYSTMGGDCFAEQVYGKNMKARSGDGYYGVTYTFADGVRKNSRIYLASGREGEAEVRHVLDPPLYKKKGSLTINNHDYVYEGLGEDLNVSLPWLTKIVVPIELKDAYMEVYPDGKVWYTYRGISKSVDLSFEYLDPYFPTYYNT